MYIPDLKNNTINICEVSRTPRLYYDQENEVVSSMKGTQISTTVKCNIIKMVAKSNSHRGVHKALL